MRHVGARPPLPGSDRDVPQNFGRGNPFCVMGGGGDAPYGSAGDRRACLLRLRILCCVWKLIWQMEFGPERVNWLLVSTGGTGCVTRCVIGWKLRDVRCVFGRSRRHPH